MDQTTIIAYALGYLAAIFGIFLLYLPLLISFGLLLLLASSVSLVVLLLKAVTLGLYHYLARLFRTLSGHLHGGGRGRKLVPH